MFILRQKRFLAFCLFAAVVCAVPLLILAARNHHDAPAELVTMALIGMFCGFGLAVLIALVVFAVYRTFFTAAPAIALAPYEDVLARMPANSFLDGEARGGTLFVTQRRLIFVPHRFNFQLTSTFIPWDDVRGCLPVPATPLSHTILTIEMRDGSLQRLVVHNRQALIGYIERMRVLVESQRAVASGVLLLALGVGELASPSSTAAPNGAAVGHARAAAVRANDAVGWANEEVGRANDVAERAGDSPPGEHTIVSATRAGDVPVGGETLEGKTADSETNERRTADGETAGRTGDSETCEGKTADSDTREVKTVVMAVPPEISPSPSVGEPTTGTDEAREDKTVVTNTPIEISLSPDVADRAARKREASTHQPAGADKVIEISLSPDVADRAARKREAPTHQPAGADKVIEISLSPDVAGRGARKREAPTHQPAGASEVIEISLSLSPIGAGAALPGGNGRKNEAVASNVPIEISLSLSGAERTVPNPVVEPVGHDESATIVTTLSPLALAAGLKSEPLVPLAGHLRRLVVLLEDAYALKFGYFRKQRLDAASTASLTKEVHDLAQIAFERALRVRPGECLRWLDGLNELQRPAFIDFAAWHAKAAALPASMGVLQLPSPSPELHAAVAALRDYQPDAVSAPASADIIEQVAEMDVLPAEWLAFYRLANGVRVTFDSYELELAPLDPSRNLMTGLTLSHWSSKKNPWFYTYIAQTDGVIAQTSWSRGCEQLEKLEPPRPAAGSLAQWLTMAIAPVRFAEPSRKWSPGPLLPTPGVKRSQPPKIRRAKPAPDESRTRSALEDLLNRYRFNPHLQFDRALSPPSAQVIDELQRRLGIELPPDYVALLKAYGWAHFAVDEAAWPRPQAGDGGEAWSFEYGVRFFGVGADIPDALNIECVSTEFIAEQGDEDGPKLVPFCTVETSGDYYCFDEAGDIFIVYSDEAEPHPVDHGFLELLERQLTGLTERARKKLASGSTG